MSLRPKNLLVLAVVAIAGCAPARTGPVQPRPGVVDDAGAARQLLEREREAVRAGGGSSAARALRMVDLGMWDEAESLIAGAGPGDRGVRLAAAELRFRQHRYEEAGHLVDEVLAADPRNRDALLLRARLQVQAWRLGDAAATAEALLDRNGRDEAAALLVGRIRLLEKRYGDALAWAERVRGWNPNSAGAHALEADVRFWDQDPAGAEAPLVRALALDPFDPDARFNYGYAIWRRVDATQLDAMAAQWNLALEVDPLHYVTHWHWGNGHTNLTYADYAQPEDSTVRARLAPADSLIAARRVVEAVALSREVEREYPESVLPAMLRGSAFYMAWGMDRGARLDSAEHAFREVLARKRNYGPAHNGLAAVIKQRQFTVLAAYDSLEAAIAAVALPAVPALDSVFPDLRYYPGDRVTQMARMELGPSTAYIPLIERQGRRYRIPPLHQDLAQAMGRSFFRTATTFDNRQWMDIRGVGSGAAGIEYVERGAHQERKVLLHEFVHLFHGIVFTDEESRRVRDLYHRAMAEDRTLDYYASNNESEFLAQAYPAFLSPVKVHPLNHKSMNTHGDLRAKDPATYAWIDSLVARQRRYLAGDSQALASNWAQVYVNLSETARRGRDGSAQQRVANATALLDTAMVWDPGYVPAMLSRAALLRDNGRFADAESWLDHAGAVAPDYAPVHAARAELIGAQARRNGGFATAAVDAMAEQYLRALDLEDDLAERASLSRTLRELYADHGRLPEAMSAAATYVEDAPTISTYLRDRRDEAAAYERELASRAGYARESLGFLRDLVSRKPQNYPHRAQLADALVMAGELEEAVDVLDEAQRILRAGGSPSAAFAARIAEIRLLQGDTSAAREAMAPILDGSARPDPTDLRVARVLIDLGLNTDAHRQLSEHPDPHTPARAAALAYTRGYIAEWRGDPEEAEREYRTAIGLDPYLADARIRLVRLLAAAGRASEADAAMNTTGLLAPGPDLAPKLRAARDDRSGTPPSRTLL